MSDPLSLPSCFHQPIHLGPLPLQPFGILVATGVLFGAWITRLRARYLGVDENEVRTLDGYVLVAGFLGAHVFDAIFYNWQKLKVEPWLLFKVWEGISSYGGFLGAAIGFVAFCRIHKVKRPLVYADILVWGLLPGFAFGRMGCTTVFDHPGGHTDFFLGMVYPYANLIREGVQPGDVIHNLGLYELIFLIFLIGVVTLVTWAGRKRPVGFVAGITCMAYGPVRFMLDFLRWDQTDPRELGLTFAQYVSIATFLIGIAVMWRAYTAPKWDPEEEKFYRDGEKIAAEKTGQSAKKKSDGGSSSAKKKRKKHK